MTNDSSLTDSANLFLCVDCGGTKTAVAIANREGKIVARGTGGPSNFAYLGLANFLKTVQAAVEDALKNVFDETRTLPTATPTFHAAWFGISGVDSLANVALLTPPLAALLSLPADAKSHRLTICNDTHLLAAPLQFYPDLKNAVCVIGGTGSIAASFRSGRDGRMLEDLARVGGWGWILGDEGGGFDVGRQTIRSMLREYEDAVLRGEEDPLAVVKESWLIREVMGVFGVEEPPELLAMVHDPDPNITDEAKAKSGPNTPLPGTLEEVKLHPYRLIAREKRLSQLAPLVFTGAFTHSDDFARRVLETTAASLASQAATLLRLPAAQALPNDKFVLAKESVLCFGGSLVGVEAYRGMVVHALKEQGHDFAAVEFVGDAAQAGALGLVRHFVG